MRKIAKFKLRKVLAKCLAGVMVILSVFYCDIPAFASENGSTDTQNQALSQGSLILGNQNRDAQTGEYFYPDVTVNKSDVRSVIVAFKGNVASGSEIKLPSDTANITLGNGTNTYKIIKVASGTSKEDIQNYIRDIRFVLDVTDESADIMIIVSDDEITGTVYYDYGNRHFYQFVSGSVTWKNARESALNMSVGGRGGYLATVTSEREDNFLGTVGNNQYGWLGGTRLVRSGSTFNYSAQTISESDAGTNGKYPWYWADGPEKNTQFFNQAAASQKSYYSYTGFFKNYYFNMDVISVNASNISYNYKNFYYNANNYKTCEPVNSKWFTDSCLIRTNYGSPDSARSYSWIASEYNSTSNVAGYYVEYGDKVTGDSHESGDSDTVIVKLRQMTNVAKPYISIDYINEEITGFDSTSSYKIKVGDGEERVFSDMSSLPISSDWFGKTIYVKACGDGIYTADSVATDVVISERHSAPVGLLGYNRTISKVSPEMEYRKVTVNDDEWIKITGDKVQKLAVGDYEVRYSATSTSFKSEPTIVSVEYYGADINVTASRKVDVALSVGITGTAYNQFKEDLINAIVAKSPDFDFSNLNIMSATSVNTSGQSTFAWLQFDHSNSLSIYNSNTFIEYTGSQSTNDYNSQANHIVSADNGTKLTFYGYGSSGYADFMLLENDQQTNKKFQFAIKEYFGADALYGTGFFFNCNMKYSGYATKEIAYTNQALLMDGYLAVLEYDANSSGAKTTGLYIYEFTNLNLYKFHTQSNSGVKAGLEAAGATVSLKTSVGTGTIKTNEDLRKIIIDVSPKNLKIYYAGFDDTSHNGTVVTTQAEADAQVFNTSNAGYIAFEALSFDDLAKKTPVVNISLNTNYGGSDFGPMTKYGSHNCSKMTKVEMSELSMSMDVVKSLSETLREPNWTDGADKFLVNLNEDPIEDFDNVSVTAELLNRLKNDDIYYIGWCGKNNSTKSYQFLQKNDLRGTIISVDNNDNGTDSSGTRFYRGDYYAQINAIADCIIDRYGNNSGTETDSILITDIANNKNVVISNADAFDTADSEWTNGKWRIDYYDNYKAKDNDSEYDPETTWMSDFQCDFDKCGVYKIYYNYEEGDEPIRIISIHDAPIVTIDANITVADSTASAVLTALVDDTNQASGKSYTYKWSYKNLGTKARPITNPSVVDAGSERTADITGMVDGAVYIVTLEVTDDLFNYTVITSRQITYTASSSSSQVKTPPTAFFSLNQSNVLMKSGQPCEVIITDSSYDPAGDPITKWVYTLYKVTGGVAEKTGETITVTDGKYTVPSSKPSGEYAIGLKVTSANGTSSEMKRNFTVVNDTTAPKVDFSLNSCTLPLNNSQTIMTFSDAGGSGYKGYRYYVSTSTATPLAEQWSVMSSGNEKTVTFPMINGSYYVHYQIEDNAGNVKTAYEGPFVRNQILNTPSVLSFAEGDSPVLTWTGDDRINETGTASYTVTIYKNGKVFDEINGLTDNQYIAANIVRGGDGRYTFTVQSLSTGNKAATAGSVQYISGQVSEVSAALDYVKPEESSVNGGNLNLDNLVTQDKIDEVFQGHATLVSDDPLEIALNSDINLKETLMLSNSIIINLNGHTIKGPDGTKESPDGKPAIKVVADNVKIILRGEGQVIGGNGYSDSEGGNGGNGGSGISFGDTEDGSVVTGEDTTVKGGDGGESAEGVGGNGGSGIEGNDVDATIGGKTTGGDGGSGATTGGDGGNGIETTGDSDVKVKEGAEVNGGNGGDGQTGGNGGSGINADGGSADIDSGADINGGNGGNGDSGNGGTGGTGVDAKDSDIDNRGNVTGGDGGTSTGASGGNGGNAYDTDGGNVNNYDGETTGGNAGTDTGLGNQKPEDGKTNNTTGKANGGIIDIPEISEDATEEELESWALNVKNQLDNVFGKDNAGYDPENKKIILYNDIQLENPLEPAGDLTIDLNGHTITGADGTKESPDGQPAIKMPEGSKLKVENTGDKEGGIYGGNGYSGQGTGEDGNPLNGGNGGDAISFDGSGTADVGEDVNLKGGNGGNSSGADAGDGGSAIKGQDVDTNMNGNVIGGNGGNGGLTGGNGGTAIDAGEGAVTVGENSKINGGNGGSGDVGGNGGNAIDYSNPNSDVIIPENANVSGGKGGTSVNGTNAEDGDASENTYKPAGGIITSPITQEKLDEIFGPDSVEYDADTNTIKLKKDIELDDTVVIEDDINIDLNGHTLKGPDGTPDSINAKPAIRVNGDANVNITDSSESGEGQIIGGNGADVSSESAAGNGAPAVDINGNGTVNIDKDVDIIGGNGGNNTVGPAGNGGSAVNVSSDSELNVDGNIVGGNGGYSSKGNGGNGGSAVSGSGADITISGNATGGNGGNSNNSAASAGKGGNVVDGNQKSLDINGGTNPGIGGTNKKDDTNPGANGDVATDTTVTYNVVTELERLNYLGNTTVQINNVFKAALSSVLANNRYVSLPDTIQIKINNKKVDVLVLDREIEADETFEQTVYSKADGRIYVPAALVTGSIFIKAELKVVSECTVSTTEEFMEAVKATVGTIKLGEDIVITEDVEIDKTTIIESSGYDITVKEGVKLTNAGKITGTGNVNNKGTVDNTGKLDLPIRNEGTLKNSENGDIRKVIDLGGTVDNTATVNGSHIAVWYVANNGTDDIHEELIPRGESYDVWVNTYKNGTKYFVEWNTKKDGTGLSYTRKQIIADEYVEHIILYAIWSSEDAGAKIGDTYYKDMKEALEWAENGDIVELEKDYEVTEDLTIPENVIVDTKGKDIAIDEDATLTVDGKLDVKENGTLDNNGTLKNNGIVSNDGNISNTGNLVNTSTGVIAGKGDVDNAGMIGNDGDIAVSGNLSGTEKISGKGSLLGNMDTIAISKDNDTSLTGSINAEVGESKVTIIIESVDKENQKSEDIIYNVKIGSAYDFIKSAIGIDGLDSLGEGDDVFLKFTIAKIDDNVDEDKEVLFEKIAADNSDDTHRMVVGSYIDISYQIKINSKSWQEMTELENEIEITIQIPEDIRGKDRYYIIRNHDGVCDILTDLDVDSETITFKTDRFSTYAIAYDEAIEEVEIPKTNDDSASAINMYVMFVMIAAGCVLLMSRKKRIN